MGDSARAVDDPLHAMTRRHLPLLALLAASAAGCRDTTVPVLRDFEVRIEQAPDTLGVGDSVRLYAFVDAGNDPHWAGHARWLSRAPAIASIDSAGSLRALSVGSTWLVAGGLREAHGVADSVRLEVVAESRSLRLTTPRDSVSPFETIALQVSADPALGRPIAEGALRFSSSDTLIARVDSLTGQVFVAGDGDVTIAVTDGTRRSSTTLRSWLTTIETGDVRLSQISIGWGFGCGLDAAGAAWCWGANNLGQLGRGTRQTGQAMLPFGPVLTSTRYSAISAGRGGACGLTQAGGVECWGTRTLTGMQASLTLDQRTVPVAVTFPAGAGRIVRIDVGTRGPLCAIDESGANYCFGDNTYRGIGGTTATVTALRPVPGSPASGLQSIGSGELHGCGATTTGTLWCWGNADSWGGNTGNTLEAAVVGGVPAFRDVVAGYQATCALAADGTAWCGGIFGSINDWTPLRPLPMLPGAAPLVRLEGGTEYTCGLAANGEASCWAHGHPSLTPFHFSTTQPVPLSRRDHFVDVGAGPSGVCGVTAAGLVRCLTFRLAFQ